MGDTVKEAQPRDPSSPTDLAASPVPQIGIQSTFAPGKKGPTGTSPRTNYSRVNTGAPPAPDAGAEAQKSMAPRGAEMLPQKVASFRNEDAMGTMTQRPRLQDMVKTAMANSVDRMDITAEATRQAANLGEEKRAESQGETRAAPAPAEKKASAEYALKLASAVEFIVDNLGKEASTVSSPEGVSQSTKSETFPAHQGQGHHQPPMHPGLQKGLKTEQGATQLENTLDHPAGGSEKMIQTNYGKKTAASEKKDDDHKLKTRHAVGAAVLGGPAAYFGAKKGVEHSGQGHALEGAARGFGGAAAGGLAGQLAGHLGAAGIKKLLGKKIGPVGEVGLHAVGNIAGSVAGGAAGYKHFTKKFDKEKKGGADIVALIREQTTKTAEDAINPAGISAGAAVPPETSASGQGGGQPAGGAPQGPTGLVGSNESAQNYTRGQAYGNRKDDLKKYFAEPALSSETDKTLAQAFEHTGQAGTKFSSAGGLSTKTAAAKALIAKLAEEAGAQPERRSA